MTDLTCVGVSPHCANDGSRLSLLPRRIGGYATRFPTWLGACWYGLVARHRNQRQCGASPDHGADDVHPHLLPWLVNAAQAREPAQRTQRGLRQQMSFACGENPTRGTMWLFIPAIVPHSTNSRNIHSWLAFAIPISICIYVG